MNTASGRSALHCPVTVGTKVGRAPALEALSGLIRFAVEYSTNLGYGTWV
jgi:hypothetical protein